MENITLWQMIQRGWPVLSVLCGFSVISCAIMLDRWLALRSAKTDTTAFIDHLLRLLDEEGRSRTIEWCGRFTEPVASVSLAILRQPGGRDELERAMRHAIQEQIHELEKRITFLGSVASTAPFVGLLGTVIGIIGAFRDIARNAGGGPEVVSGGIAEALVTTAFGLVVAIPAVIGFNFFVNAIRRMASEIELASFHLIEKLVQGRM